MNTIRFSASLLLLGAVALPAAADDAYYDTARVLSVTPQTERINTPRQDCRTDYDRDVYYDSGKRDVGGAILGGITGGLIGSQIGKGRGRIAGAAVGAAAGAIVGDRIDNSDRRGYAGRPVERCVSIDDWHTVNRGYLVTYRYNGRDYTTTMPHDPGRNVRVRVAIAPEFGDDRTAYLVPGHPGYRDDDDDYPGSRDYRHWN